MLDIARMETSLDAKRRDLAAKILEGRAFVASMMERQAILGRKIDDANAALKHLEHQLEATKTVMGLFDDEGLVLAAAPVAAPPTYARPTLVPPAAPAVMKREPVRFLSSLKCKVQGHQMVASRSAPGYATCARCRVRRAI